MACQKKLRNIKKVENLKFLVKPPKICNRKSTNLSEKQKTILLQIFALSCDILNCSFVVLLLPKRPIKSLSDLKDKLEQIRHFSIGKRKYFSDCGVKSI